MTLVVKVASPLGSNCSVTTRPGESAAGKIALYVPIKGEVMVSAKTEVTKRMVKMRLRALIPISVYNSLYLLLVLTERLGQIEGAFHRIENRIHFHFLQALDPDGTSAL